MTAKLKTAILGATGYSGFELARILLRHPGVETPVLLQRSGEGASSANLAEMYPAISGNGGYPLRPLSWPELQRQTIELLFLATPHEVSRELVPQAIASGMRVVDLSGAWRLREAQHRVQGQVDGDELTNHLIVVHHEHASESLRHGREGSVFAALPATDRAGNADVRSGMGNGGRQQPSPPAAGAPA